MKTPICDFVLDYANSKKVQLHMPGHKGTSFLGIEHLDITEIEGADSLYESNGIISESEKNASELFGCDTYYSTEGSSQCIKAMMYLVLLYAKNRGERPLILAGRNAHKAFHSAVALLDIEVQWIYPDKMQNYLSCCISAEELDDALKKMPRKPTALYLTSPDYLGSVADMSSIAQVCKKEGILLVVDNAHGAYLKFLPKSLHPIDLGADICCDSAHKTLPVLTGGAYLHISNEFSEEFKENVKDAMVLFGSTSPSYLILQSLDLANVYLEHYRDRLETFIVKVSALKEVLIKNGFSLYGDEHLKITVQTKSYGYTGQDFANILYKNGIICEFADPDFVVLMLTPEISDGELDKIEKVMMDIPKKEEITDSMPSFHNPQAIMSIREAVFSPSETVSIEQCLERIASVCAVGCPPAVPVVVSGEIIDEHIIECFNYYGIKQCKVVK